MANNFPNILPSFNADFVNGIYVDPRITFTRAGTRTYFGQEVVKAEENLLLQSQTFDNAAWTKTAVTISANSTAAPDGTTTADTVTGSAGTTLKTVFPAAANTGLASAVATFSIFAKEGTHRYIQISINGDATKYVNFDLNGSGATSAFGSGVTSSVTAAANGFIRCAVSLTGHPNTSRFYVSLQDSLAAAREASTASTGDIFLWGAQTELRSAATAYTPTTTQPITRYQRLLRTAAANEWPREFDPVTGECLGRSVWESRTNLLLRSEEFDNAYWEKTNVSASANQTIAPDGTLTADLITENTASGFHVVQRAFTTSAVIYSLTIFAKAGTRNWLQLRITDGTNLHAAFFNLSTGAVGTVTASAVATITSIGNGWYRCSVTPPSAVLASASGYMQYAFGSADNTPNYTGNGTGNMFIWGAQLEAGAFPTPYIPTVASQITRLADSAVMTGTNFSSWFNPEQGCLFREVLVVANAGGVHAFVGSGNLTNIEFGTSASALNYLIYVEDNNAVIASLTEASSNYPAGVFHKFASSYKTDNFAASGNGRPVLTDTSGNVPLLAEILRIGNYNGTTNFLNGYIKRLTYYPQALTSANLQAITR